MKKRIAFIIALIILGMAFVSCAKNGANGAKKGEEAALNPDYERVAGVYTHINEASEFGTFSITLYRDGTCQYYETIISSYIGSCRYKVEGDIVTIEDGSFPSNPQSLHTFRFRHEEGKLSYIAEGSDSFLHVSLEDGAEFGRQSEP